MNATSLYERFLSHVVEFIIVLLISFGRNRDDVLLFPISRLILWLNGELPVALEHLLDAGLADLIPLATKTILNHGLESFVDEDASTESAYIV